MSIKAKKHCLPAVLFQVRLILSDLDKGESISNIRKYIEYFSHLLYYQIYDIKSSK